MRTIGVVTTSRADYGTCLPILRRIAADPDLRLHLIVGGLHLSPEFGLSVSAIEADGFDISERVEMLLSSDTPEGIAKSMGLGTVGYAQAYGRHKPDILLVIGDRFEMHAAALAALPFKIPVAHLHGGELTEGAIDDALRHSITKLSHLHFVSSQEYGRRVEQLGEEPWRITVCGAPALDNLGSIDLVSIQELESRLAMSLDKAPLVVTYHPVTLEYEQTEWQVTELLEALLEWDFPVVFTMPNADTKGRIVHQMLSNYVETNPNCCLVDNLGTQYYVSLLAQAAAMVGNSSSGMVEAAPFRLPVVNIGTRQKGRIRTENIIDVGYHKKEINKGIKKAVSKDFRDGLSEISNTLGDGNAAERIVCVLKETSLDQRLLTKQFMDIPELLDQPVSSA